MWGDHRTAPPAVILERRELCFLMIIKLHSRCWAGKLSSSGPSANKRVRWENLEDDDKVALSPSSTPKELQTAPRFYIRAHVEAILMCFSCAILVSHSSPSWWLNQPVKQQFIIIMNAWKLSILCYFLRRQDTINVKGLFFFRPYWKTLWKFLISGIDGGCNNQWHMFVSPRKHSFLQLLCCFHWNSLTRFVSTKTLRGQFKNCLSGVIVSCLLAL